MKKLLLVAVLALLFVGFSNVQAVAAGKPEVQTTMATIYEGELLEYCITGFEAYEYELLAGQDIYAGNVVISTDGEYFTVTIEGLSIIEDVHIYLYEEGEELPTKRPVPGLAPYKLEDVNDYTAEIMIPVGEVMNYTFAIHVAFAELENEENFLEGETAYAGDDDSEYNGKGAWFYLVSFAIVECETVGEAPVIYIAAHAALTNSETAWALGEFTFIDEGISNKWGWFLSIDEYGTHTFDIYYGAGNNSLVAGTLIGTLVVEYTEDEVIVTYNLTQPLLEEIQVYVGYSYPTTGAPGQYDYKVENLGGVYSASVTVDVIDLV